MKTQVLLVGAGPAGVSCALWLDSFGIDFQWVDQGGIAGGTLRRVFHPLKNYPGARFGCGAELADALQQQIAARGLVIERREVLSIEQTKALHVAFANEECTYDALVLATGTEPRELQVPGIEEVPKARRFCSSHVTAASGFAPGAEAAIVGGGDGAFEGALVLRRAGFGRVSLFVRGAEPRARRPFVAAVAQDAAIKVHLSTALRALSYRHEGVWLNTNKGEHRVDVLLVKIGVQPRGPALPAGLAQLPGGYWKVNAKGETSIPGLYAAGDLCSPDFQCVANAIGQGAQVASAVHHYLKGRV